MPPILIGMVWYCYVLILCIMGGALASSRRPRCGGQQGRTVAAGRLQQPPRVFIRPVWRQLLVLLGLGACGVAPAELGMHQPAVSAGQGPRERSRVVDSGLSSRNSTLALGGRRRLSTDVSSFSALSNAIASNAEINVVSSITMTATITISSITNLKISSESGAVLTSSFTASSGGFFYIQSSSDVTFTGLGFVSGSATDRGGCLYVSSSTVEVEDSDLTACSTVSDSIPPSTIFSPRRTFQTEGLKMNGILIDVETPMANS